MGCIFYKIGLDFRNFFRKENPVSVLYQDRVAMVREKYLEIDIFSRPGKSQGILWMVREI